MALLKKRQVDLKISPPETPKRAHRYATIITRDFSNSCTCALSTQWIQTIRPSPTPAHAPLMHSCVLKQPKAARSLLRVHKYTIHTQSCYSRLNYGKDMCNRVCYIICSHQSKLSPCLPKWICNNPILYVPRHAPFPNCIPFPDWWYKPYFA